MTAPAWLALATAVVLVPLPSAGWRRALALSRRGRLASAPVTLPRLPRPQPPPSVLGLFGCVAAAGTGYALG
ncbi:MAG: hypothetical protein ABI775_02830, partial [Pseudonocardiales bacterium]